MATTEDDYADKTISTKEYEPRTCCMSTVKILGQCCRAVDGSNASGSGLNQGLLIVANVSFLAEIAGVF